MKCLLYIMLYYINMYYDCRSYLPKNHCSLEDMNYHQEKHNFKIRE